MDIFCFTTLLEMNITTFDLTRIEQSAAHSPICYGPYHQDQESEL